MSYASSEIISYSGTATRRKQNRRAIRSVLGTSSDAAPNARQALEAAQHLSQLLELATAGNLSLRVQRGNAVATISITEAVAVVRGAVEARCTTA